MEATICVGLPPTSRGPELHGGRILDVPSFTDMIKDLVAGAVEKGKPSRWRWSGRPHPARWRRSCSSRWWCSHSIFLLRTSFVSPSLLGFLRGFFVTRELHGLSSDHVGLGSTHDSVEVPRRVFIQGLYQVLLLQAVGEGSDGHVIAAVFHVQAFNVGPMDVASEFFA